MSTYLKNNSAKFHSDPILNNGVLGFFEERRPQQEEQQQQLRCE